MRVQAGGGRGLVALQVKGQALGAGGDMTWFDLRY